MWHRSETHIKPFCYSCVSQQTKNELLGVRWFCTLYHYHLYVVRVSTRPCNTLALPLSPSCSFDPVNNNGFYVSFVIIVEPSDFHVLGALEIFLELC